jgi:phosphoribosyl 1,2-cyclic phosphodiesterase
VLDCGTGAYDLGQALLASSKSPLCGHILFSHMHWDHIQGFPFFAPFFVRDGQWDVYGPGGLGESLHDRLSGQMQSTYFPVELDNLVANIDYHDLVEGSFEIGDIRITARYLNHTALTLGYRLEMDGISVVYSCDHEPYSRTLEPNEPVSELDRGHSDFLADADLVIHDSQFTDAEYSARRGWGHSPFEYVLEVAQLGKVKHLALTHHDPMRTDDALDQIVEFARANLIANEAKTQVFAAADCQVIEIHSCGTANWIMEK